MTVTSEGDMFVAGKMFASADEAKQWVESQTTENERRHWIIIALDPTDPTVQPEPQGVAGIGNLKREE